MRIFITGLYSFVGQELVRQCKAKGIECLGVDLIDVEAKNYFKADIREPKIADLIPEGIDAIVHLAAMSRDGDCKNKGYECFDSNVMGTLNLINAAQRRNVKQFVFASTEWVYDSFKENEIKDENSVIDISKLTSEYALSKLVSEANFRQKFAHGFCPVTILRFGIIYGPREKNWSAVESLFNTVKTKDEVAVGSFNSGRCFIHVADIVAGIIASLGLQGLNIINLQGDRLITLGEVIEASKEILKCNPRLIEKDPANVSVRLVSNARAKAVLNWRPMFDLKKGLESLQG
ncbi:MAG: NAD(P)-dependent oxidoreductase [Candidatus Omnitrophica bacterium]|nr:NAD(P)-dependent oxidoreductase [Candidatus Omnitrophota bacterium]